MDNDTRQQLLGHLVIGGDSSHSAHLLRAYLRPPSTRSSCLLSLVSNCTVTPTSRTFEAEVAMGNSILAVRHRHTLTTMAPDDKESLRADDEKLETYPAGRIIFRATR